MPSDNQLPPEEVARMEEALTRHYGEPVRPVSAYCRAFEDWAKAIMQGAKDNPDDEQLGQLAVLVGDFRLSLAIRKSNYLFRRIYLGQSHRTRKCPEHDGTWSGYAFGPNTCECQVGYDLTGWLPDA